jgi:hypothetical protein
MNVWHVEKKTAAFTANAATVYVCDATAAAFAATLPPVTAAMVGSVFFFKKIDASANAVTVTADATGTADLIDGAATAVLAAQYDAVIMVATEVDKWSIFQFGSP